MTMDIPTPVLWTLSKTSGALFQAPLYFALKTTGAVGIVAAEANKVLPVAEAAEELLACPSTITTPGGVWKFALESLSDRQHLRRQLRAKASLVHVTMGSPWDALYLKAAQQAHVPVIQTVHDATRHLGEENWLLTKLEGYSYRYVDHFVTLSQFVFDELRRRPGIKAPIHLVEGGLLTQSAPPMAPRSYPTDRMPRILFLGRIHPYKGLNLLLDAIALLQGKGHTLGLTIAGSGDLSPYVTGLSKIENLTMINRWIDDDDVPPILAENDIMALPYVEASQSGVALDAQWAAMPAVATPVGALPQQFKDGTDAIIVDEVSSHAMADGLLALLTDPELYDRLSQGASVRYMQGVVGSVAEKWRSFYAEIVSSRTQK
jgi:glycosyltransferase involved in cell wall biosynthesis